MADTVTIAGKHVNKWLLYGGAGVVVIGGVLYFRSKNSSSSSTSANNSSSIDPVTGLPYSEDDTVDPLTGMTYLQEAQEYGSVSAAEQAIEEGSSGVVGSSGIAAGTPSSSSPISGISSGDGTTTTFATNAEWAQQATADLVSIGYSATDVAAALGAYLAGLPLTSDQATIVQVALAEDGPPPIGTFSIVTSPTAPATTTSTGSTSSGSTGTGSTSTGSSTGSTGSSMVVLQARIHGKTLFLVRRTRSPTHQATQNM
jgi:hypothetical protein